MYRSGWPSVRRELPSSAFNWHQALGIDPPGGMKHLETYALFSTGIQTCNLVSGSRWFEGRHFAKALKRPGFRGSKDSRCCTLASAERRDSNTNRSIHLDITLPQDVWVASFGESGLGHMSSACVN
jgi:hypothetical protein